MWSIRSVGRMRFGIGIVCVVIGIIVPSAFAVDLYLPPLEQKAALKLFAVPPASGSAEELRDREVFKSTRKLAGTPRWKAAREDNSRAIHSLLGDFSCSIGHKVKEHSFPELSLLLFKTIATGESVVNQVKAEYRRPRPFKLQSGPLCLALAEYRVSTYDYPSGHAATGELAGLVLAKLWPDRAPQILDRAQEFGESRVICGVHSLSATEAGQSLARSLFEMLQKSASFQEDFKKAKSEVSRNQKSLESMDVRQCAEEAKILSVSPRAQEDSRERH